MSLLGSNRQSHDSVLPVAKRHALYNRRQLIHKRDELERTLS